MIRPIERKCENLSPGCKIEGTDSKNKSRCFASDKCQSTIKEASLLTLGFGRDGTPTPHFGTDRQTDGGEERGGERERERERESARRCVCVRERERGEREREHVCVRACVRACVRVCVCVCVCVCVWVSERQRQTETDRNKDGPRVLEGSGVGD